MARRILVLASNSFAGAHFVDFCLKNDAEVIGISRSPEYMDSLLGYGRNPKREKQFKFYKLDLNRDMDQISKVMFDFHPEWVVDFAGQGMVAQSWSSPDQWYQTNIVAKVRFHEALRKLSSLKAYLRFSTPEVYGSTSSQILESAPLNPSTPYAVSHAAIDMSLLTYVNQYQLPAIITRASNIYGPNQQLYRIIPRAILYGLSGKVMKLDGGGRSVRNFVYMPDVCEALWMLCNNPRPGEIYHLSSDEYVSIKDLVHLIAQKIGLTIEQLAEVGPDRPGKDQAYYLDNNKIQSHYGWSSQTTLDQGLDQTLNWIRGEFDSLIKTPLEYIHKE